MSEPTLEAVVEAGPHLFTGPAAKDARYLLRIDGPLTSKAVRNTIRMLTLQAEWLEEDEATALAAPSAADGDSATGVESTGHG